MPNVAVSTVSCAPFWKERGTYIHGKERGRGDNDTHEPLRSFERGALAEWHVHRVSRVSRVSRRRRRGTVTRDDCACVFV
jgi:hypothetical protein